MQRATEDEILDIATHGAMLCQKFEELIPGTKVFYEYSPESYTGTNVGCDLRTAKGM